MTEYAERDAQALDRAGGHYCRHLNAMTAEKLDSKSDIAAELAWRDMCVADLTAALEMQNLRCAELQAHCLAVAKRCKELEAQLVSADRYTLHALAGAGICTPAEGFRKAGFNWAARGIEELAKQRDEALDQLRRREESERAAVMRMAEARERERDAESARDIDRMLGMERGNEAQGQFAVLYKRCKELEAELLSADRHILHALAGTGISTPAEGFRKAGFNRAAHGIEGLVKQRDEALARVGILEAELLRTSIPVDDFDRSEEATE